MKLKIVWIKFKSIVHLPIYRKDVLIWTKHYYANKNYAGLCWAIYNSLKDLVHVYHAPQYYIPLLNPKVVEIFHKIHDIDTSVNCYEYDHHWWKPSTWELNGGRLGFLNWLIEQYKDDKTNLRKVHNIFKVKY